MTDIEAQIMETWRIHMRITLFTIENIPDEALKATLSTRGGRDIARQLSHLHSVRIGRLVQFAKKLGIKLITFDPKESPDKANLLEAFRQSGDLMEKYIEHCLESGGAVSNFKRGVVPMVGCYISHEAHHRGGILLTMKKSGFPLSDALKWQIWDWNKM